MQDPIERKKQQNRARQRAWRKRKRATCEPGLPATADSAWRGYGMLITTDQNDSATTGTSFVKEGSPSSSQRDIPIYQNPIHLADNRKLKTDKLIPPLLEYTTDASSDRSIPAVIFPLSPDHCLITLVQYNVVRAMIFNMSILSLLYCLPVNCSRAFGVPIIDTIPPERIPLDLQPTLLQQSTPHPFWISAIPFPAMRDNLILFAGAYDSDDLCDDLGQALYQGFDDVERRGCLVWGDPWHVYGWEVTEGFLRKWGFLLSGCVTLIESTNHWRELRGEDRLVIQI